jgi:hypothetical protein
MSLGPVCLTQIKHDVLCHPKFETLPESLRYRLSNPDSTPKALIFVAVFLALDELEPIGYSIVPTPLHQRK